MAAFYKNPIYVVGMILVVGAVIFATQPDAPVKKTTVAPKKAVLTSKQGSIVMPVDYTTHFDPVVAPTKNLFKPLIAKKTLALATPAGTAGIPASLTGGDPNWYYTGMATVDGAKTALVENQTTGASVFLHQGQRWMECTVSQISDDKIVLTGIDEMPTSVKVKDVNSNVPKPLSTRPGVLNGPIGNMAIVPNDGTVVDDTGTGGTTGGGGRGGRGGRNGRGGRGGRGGGVGTGGG